MPKKSRHYDRIVADDLLSGPSATNQSPTAYLTRQAIEEAITKLWQSNMRISGNYVMLVAPGLHDIFRRFLEDFKEWTPEEMAKQVELYRNVIETKYGVKLCVKRNLNSDVTSMEILVPNKLFAGEDGRQSLADALQNIAMFIMSMDDPAL